MADIRVVGAGLGRTGTHSLKLALERLLGGRCYHMSEVFQRPEHVPIWHAAARGEPVDFRKLLDGYVAAVDWPPAAFWPELSAAFPDAVIVLSSRDADAWWNSASRTIFEIMRRAPRPHEPPGWRAMIAEILRRFTPDFLDEAAAKAAFERHNADVRRRAPASRLVDWTAPDGWAPLCAALGVPVPNEPFPVTNTEKAFRAQAQLDV